MKPVFSVFLRLITFLKKNHGFKELSYILFTDPVCALKSITEFGVDPDPHGSRLFWETGSGSALEEKARSRSALKVKFRSLGSSKGLGGPWTLTMEAWRLKMEPWRVCRPHQIFITLLRSRNQIRILSEKSDPDLN